MEQNIKRTDLSIPTVPKLDLRKKTRLNETIIGGLLFFCGAVSIFTTIGIVITLGSQAVRLFSHEQCVENAGQIICENVSLTEFLTTTTWFPRQLSFGVLPLLLSTVMTSFIAMMVAVPLGLGAAIYLSEYATPRVRRILKPILEILAGIPTVVYGFFALTFMTPILRSIFGNDTVNKFNKESAGLVLGIIILPLMASMSEDALSAVPP
jgi:phosphate transport system permease protein